MTKTRGFCFDETMSGTYTRVDDPDCSEPLSFSVHVNAPSVRRYIRDKTVDLRGTLEAPGLAEFVPIEGTMVLDPLGQRVIRYEFHFIGDDGRPYRFAGEKALALGKLRQTLTRLPAKIYDASNRVVATSETRFDLRGDWWRFLTSWRPTKHPGS